MANLKCFMMQTYFLILILTLLKPNVGYSGRKYTRDDILKLREEVREMFDHAYSGYLKYAYPYDELRPLTCDGVDTWGSYSLTLIDALDTLAVMGNYSEFRRVVGIVTSKANFDANINVSVFETNIRIVGGLLSAHLLSKRAGLELEPGWPCNGPLLRLAEDVAKRLIAAFDTSTGMPYGTVNLRHGVPPGETSITCTAGVGTYILEFGTLSRLTGDPIYEELALNALYALYNHRSSIGLYGNHIDVLSGRWTAQDSGIGAGVDSYLEYLVKGALLVQRPELMAIFNEGRVAIDKHNKRNDWYLWVSMYKGQVTLPVFQSLEAYWPGVLSLIGDISGGMKSMHNYHQVWKQYGFTPEFYNIAQGQVGTNRESYPLRPELIESTMYLYRATKDPFLLDVGMDILRSIQHSARTKCGYATIKDCRDHSLENRMESFFLAETTKYLYLLFDPDNFIHNRGEQGTVHTLPSGRECILDAGGYIFNTEAHPIDPGALLCCSENFDERKRYNLGAARGEKFTQFVKQEGVKVEQEDSKPLYDNPLHDFDPLQKLPSALAETDEEFPVHRDHEFLDKLKNSGAVDIVKISPPSHTEVHSIGNEHQTKLSLNMLQMIETLISNNQEEHLLKTAWSRDLLIELVEVIERAEKALNVDNKLVHNDNDASESINSNLKLPSRMLGTKEIPLGTASETNDLDDASNTENVTLQKHPNQSVLEDVEDLSETYSENEAKKGLITENAEEENLPTMFSSHGASKMNIEERLDKSSNKKKAKSLFELVMTQQFKSIKDTVLTEATVINLHLKKCMTHLELTKNLADILGDCELKSQFFTRRLEVMILATDMQTSLEETRKLLSVEESGEGITIMLFKRLIDLVVDGKTVKDFFEKYKRYIEVAKNVISIGRENYEIEQTNIKTYSQDENTIMEGDVNESDEVNNNYEKDLSGSFFQNNNWRADDISYQVDDRERVSPVSKVDTGPLFTDKLRLKTESVTSLIPRSLITTEIPFNPQLLLERIRESPRYHRNTTWVTSYDLLTCMPQPYFTRIMLSGEFFND